MKNLRIDFSHIFKRNFIIYFLVVSILILGFTLRAKSIESNNLMFGYDEIEDLIHVERIVFNHDLIVIGKAIYGNPNIRHGVLSYYFMAPGSLLFNGNPIRISLWDGLFNLSGGLVIYFLAKSLFKRTQTALITLTIYVFSYLIIEYSNWVSHPTFSLLFISLFYLGIWEMYVGKKYGIILSILSIALAIQSNLLFLYLIPVFVIFLIIFKPKYPDLKSIFISIFLFLITMSTIIYTEIKFNFSGIKTILNFSSSFDEGKINIFERFRLFLEGFFRNFSLAILPTNINLGILMGIIFVLIGTVIFFISKKEIKYKVLFILFILFSPAITLFLGFHNKPWSFIGILPAIPLLIGFIISKLKYKFIIFSFTFIIIVSNVYFVYAKERGTFFLEVPKSSILSAQMDVVDYTYTSSKGKPFSIDAVTYPLYVNTYWSYHYPFYGLKNYGSIPSWSGSDQIYPYNTLPRSKENENLIYLIIDETPDIPSWAKNNAIKYWDSKTKIIEEKTIGGFFVQKRIRL